MLYDPGESRESRKDLLYRSSEHGSCQEAPDVALAVLVFACEMEYSKDTISVIRKKPRLDTREFSSASEDEGMDYSLNWKQTRHSRQEVGRQGSPSA